MVWCGVVWCGVVGVGMVCLGWWTVDHSNSAHDTQSNVGCGMWDGDEVETESNSTCGDDSEG